jgi:hypothetical protein
MESIPPSQFKKKTGEIRLRKQKQKEMAKRIEWKE